MPTLSDRYKILFILFISLGVYYSSIFGEFNSVDDQAMITALINTKRINLKEVFLPFSPFDYYRPILWLSFLLDRFIFSCSETIMHFENILLHSLNGVMVFLIFREINRIFKKGDEVHMPMFVSLLFILHPINTEAVNFISGRTDILAGFFVFLSIFIFVRSGLKSYTWCLVSAIFYLFGLLSKEVAIGTLPAMVIFLITKGVMNIEQDRIKKGLKLISPYLFVTFLYFILRFIASGHADSGVIKTVGVFSDRSLLITISGAIKAFGFYIKKLFIPIPLNFGIIEIKRTFYFWFGMSVFLLCLYYIVRKIDLRSFYFFFSIVFFLPAIPLAVSRIAWTPLAERYLYISSFGIASFIIMTIHQIRLRRNLISGIISVLLILSAFITVNRNIIWQSNYLLYADTIKKSPDFAPARNEYGVALMQKGRYKEALEQFKLARQLAGNSKYSEIPALNIIAIEGLNKKPEEVKTDYLRLLKNSSNPHAAVSILKRVIEITENQIRKENGGSKTTQLCREEIGYLEELFKLERDSFCLYRIGQLYLAINEKKKAKDYFGKTIELSPNSFYAHNAKKILERLGSEKKVWIVNFSLTGSRDFFLIDGNS